MDTSGCFRVGALYINTEENSPGNRNGAQRSLLLPVSVAMEFLYEQCK